MNGGLFGLFWLFIDLLSNFDGHIEWVEKKSDEKSLWKIRTVWKVWQTNLLANTETGVIQCHAEIAPYEKLPRKYNNMVAINALFS